MNKTLKNQISTEFKADMFGNIVVAINAFKEAQKAMGGFLNYNGNKKALIGHMLTYAIDSQVYNNMLYSKSYSVQLKEVNNFKYTVPLVHTEKFIISIGRTKNNNCLPNEAKYKQQLAAGNKALERQISFPIFDSNENVKPYAVITYGYREGILSHLTLVLPNDKFSKIEDKENLFDYQGFYRERTSEYEQEVQVATLKQEIIEHGRNKRIKNNVI